VVDVVEDAMLARGALACGLEEVAVVDVDDEPVMLALRTGARRAGCVVEAGATDCRLVMTEEGRGAVLGALTLEGRAALGAGAVALGLAGAFAVAVEGADFAAALGAGCAITRTMLTSRTKSPKAGEQVK
jgi:hypothetical protein